MTAPAVRKASEPEGFRVIAGRRLRRPMVAPWMVMAMIAVAAFLGLGFARTSLDRTAFELSELERSIALETALNQELKLEIARLESPARIAPLAEDMGMMLPKTTNQILVELDPEGPAVVANDTTEDAQ